MHPTQHTPSDSKMTEAEKKRRQREKKKAIAEGTYEATLISQAKSLMEQQVVPDYKLILLDPQFSA
jgi:hypothetical protein